MKPLLVKIRSAREPGVARPTTDDNLGRGMDLALTIAFFLVIGWLVDRWLGTSPVVTIIMIVLAGVGGFVRMKYAYDASMERLEAERRDRLQVPQAAIEDVA